MFAAGFLFKLLSGKDPVNLRNLDVKTASLVIQQYRARLEKELMMNLDN